jgi:hypothetical protein
MGLTVSSEEFCNNVVAFEQTLIFCASYELVLILMCGRTDRVVLVKNNYLTLKHISCKNSNEKKKT